VCSRTTRRSGLDCRTQDRELQPASQGSGTACNPRRRQNQKLRDSGTCSSCSGRWKIVRTAGRAHIPDQTPPMEKFAPREQTSGAGRERQRATVVLRYDCRCRSLASVGQSDKFKFAVKRGNVRMNKAVPVVRFQIEVAGNLRRARCLKTA